MRLLRQGLEEGGFRYYAALLTLTYANGGDWRAKHVSELLTLIRNWCERRGVPFQYVWALELQQRGAPHYHIVVFLPRRFMLPKPDKRGWWRHGMTNIKQARNAYGYLAKYVSKGETAIGQQGAMAKGARISGCGGLNKVQRRERSWWNLPKWVRDECPIEDDVCKVNGGYLARATGYLLRSPWVFVRAGEIDGARYVILREAGASA